MKKIMFNDRFGLTDAVLEGRKTVTRRIAKESNDLSIINGKPTYLGKQQYQVGEVVAIAQKYKDIIDYSHYSDKEIESISKSAGWSNKIFVLSYLMPSQIEIIDVRVERLQDITDEDCIKEGIMADEDNYFFRYDTNGDYIFGTPLEAFAELIDKVAKKGTWESNPYVFRYEFKLK
ncbi:hypothetical protein [Dysgonomonas mossii]|uniref:ASCH domain-containing protein n=1 Tax=Dysgonomonas mossii DSM 22836 TaxID=742767 RepID=F8X577_9BACT|nr:hypothetical protein [Dysgonomonas mossii]EGK04683.1 hypothetical protein HMPREF9456_03386 [Dysgonomonas mossii DSM 22836]